MRGTARIAEQVGQIGVFGEITLECFSSDVSSLLIPSEFTEWKISVEFGIDYFLRHSGIRYPLKVSVIDVATNAVDTSNMTIAFVTVHALCRAINEQLPYPPEFDKERVSFYFRK